MDFPRPCGCKGCRTCLICEDNFKVPKKQFDYIKSVKNIYVFCPWCNKAWEGWDMNSYKTHPNHSGNSIDYPGIFIQMDFLTESEEQSLLKGIDEMHWDLSQSGRRKQNFGPKCNFKKQKLRVGNFNGFPAFTKFVQDKFNDFHILTNYQSIEQCSLEYDPSRGASIDPHIDDCWIWGERIVTVNLLSDSVLTMTPYDGDSKKYNLYCIENYPPVLDSKGCVLEKSSLIGSEEGIKIINQKCDLDIVVRIPMPRRSLLVIYGAPRYRWEHCVLREDVSKRRVCIAYREFTPPYLEGGKYENEGSEIIEKAKVFWDHKVAV